MNRVARNVLLRVGRRTVVTEVRDEDHLAQLMKDHSKVVIDFTADWCGPCQSIKGAYEKLSEDVTDVAFLKVNVDDNPDIGQEYEALSIPHFVGLHNGKSHGTVTGARIEAVRSLAEELKSI
eukprot:TRINITY_DN4954_c0_g1_i1.p1 TRINITY_DN4954_c0_g1~~TRINITY_DN4954_c0_g1_i1.p1  ORF type:complete len:136 (+),score=52.25 TRINITY_DN4954_c0_g1_i1:44-409(+)